MKNKQTVEFFSGTESFSKVAKKRGYATYTFDINPSFRSMLWGDILKVEANDFPKNIFVLWASPPCKRFSVASIGKSWCKRNYCPSRSETALAMAHVLRTIELIKELKPKYWFIENPRGILRKMAFMDGLHRKTVSYCQYGDKRMKPTDIWTNLVKWKPRKMCKNGDSCHEAAPRGSKTGTQGLKSSIERGVIPPALFEEIFDVVEGGKYRK